MIFRKSTKTNPGRSLAFSAAYAFFLAICLFISLKTVLNNFGIDEDTSQSLMLWYGVKAWGLHSIPQYHVTPDNWLLSVVPVNFLLFALFGARPELVVLWGWFAYALSALVSAWIAWELQARRAALAIMPVLLCLGNFALQSGFAAYAFSHNITNTYGMFTLLFTIKWFRQARMRYLPLIFGCLIIGAISDPWMLVAYELPLLGIGILGAVQPFFGAHRNVSALFACTVTAAIGVAETKAFGLLRFIPSQPSGFASFAMARHNLIYLFRDLGGMLNLFPNQAWNAPAAPARSLILITIGLCLAFSKSYRSHPRHPTRRLFAAFAVLSIGITTTAFVVLDIVAEAYSARFLMNVLYLTIIGFAIIADLGWRDYALILRGYLAFISSLFFIASLASTQPAWRSSSFYVHDYFGIDTLSTFLEQNNLTYGYGPFHGSHSNAVTATSHDTVKLRPARFNPQSGMIMTVPRVETYNQWLAPLDFPAQSKNFFVFVTSDGEECPNLQLCKFGLVQQFGKPRKILQYAPTAWIYIWPRSSLANLYVSRP